MQKAEEEANLLTGERVSLLLELGASKDELSSFLAEAYKEKKALEEEFHAGFEVIFNYGYGCCAFAHNICGITPWIPTRMPDTSKLLPPEFFYQSLIPPECCPRVFAIDPNVNIREELSAEGLPTAEEGLRV